MATLNHLRNIFVGTSGWAIARQIAPGSRPGLSGLERYAEYFNAVEVTSTFYRLPQRTTIERWRDSTPPGFHFAVKLPRTITHEARLEQVQGEVNAFCELIGRFGKKLGALLVQLPPSLPFELGLVSPFLEHITRVSPARVVLEPRHPTWFGAEGERLLREHGVARAGADPACCAVAAEPHGAPAYFRWHGSPRKYFSAYLPETLGGLAARMLTAKRDGGARGEVYCFLDNTALGAAAVNAITLKAALLAASEGGLSLCPTRRSGVSANDVSPDRARAGVAPADAADER